MRAPHLVNEGFGKEFYRKVNSVKRSGPSSELLDSEIYFFRCSCPSKSRLLTHSYYYDRPGQPQRPRMADLENSRKTAQKGAGWARAKCRGNSRKTAGKTPEACKTAVFRLFGCPTGCFSAVFPALCPGPTRHLFRLFSGCFQGPPFGASVAGRADRNPIMDTESCCQKKEISYFDRPVETLAENLSSQIQITPCQVEFRYRYRL